MSTKRRLRAVLKINKNNIPLLLALAQVIYSKMLAGGTLFSSSPIAFATVQSQIEDLSDAQAGVRLRTVMASTRNAERDVLLTTLETLLMYVQGLSDNSPEGAAIIEAAGMTVAAFRKPAKPPLGVKLGKISGNVVLSANADLLAGKSRRKRFFNWSWSIDGGKSWQSAPSTPYAKTTIEGLPLLTSCSFRVSVTDASGQGPWTDSVSIVVL